ncbi:MAG: carboxymuconolactone decarboxylase family protein [Candidatus Binatia bacterium]
MKDHVLVRLGELEEERKSSGSNETNRVKELVSVGAAFAVNCVSNLKEHLGAAEAMGISQEDIAEILNLSRFIKEKGASHVERLGGMLD